MPEISPDDPLLKRNQEARPNVADLSKTPFTEEEEKAHRRYCDRMMELHNQGARLDAHEQFMLHKVRMEQFAAMQIAHFEQYKTSLPEEDGDHARVDGALEHHRKMRAVGLLEQGRLHEAEATHPIVAEEAQRRREALARPDDEVCECENQADAYTENRALSRHFVEREIYSLADAAWYKLVVCSQCGHANARGDLPAFQERMTPQEWKARLDRQRQEKAADGN